MDTLLRNISLICKMPLVKNLNFGVTPIHTKQFTYNYIHRSNISQCLDIQVFSGNKISFRQSYLYIINLIQYHF